VQFPKYKYVLRFTEFEDHNSMIIKTSLNFLALRYFMLSDVLAERLRIRAAGIS
jgi:hypothetical protein